jgi:hypothetical protein
MTKTNLNRCSKLALAALVVFAAFSFPAAAVTVGDEDVPGNAEVDSQVSATVTLTELYKDPQLEQWTLAGETELEDVTWTVTYYDQTGAKVNQTSFDGQNFTGATVSAADGTSEVDVKITGTVPEIEEYSYDPQQSFRLMALEQTRKGGSSNEIDAWESSHYTSESEAARTAIEEAESAIEAASGANTGEAEKLLDRAVDAYNGGNFDNAQGLASDAAESAEEAEKSSQTMQLALYAVGGLVVVGLLAGGFLWYRSQQDSYDKLG